MNPRVNRIIKDFALLGIVYLLIVPFKSSLLYLALLDSCHGAGGLPYDRICNPAIVPYWLSIGFPSFIDFVVLLLILLVLVFRPSSQRGLLVGLYVLFLISFASVILMMQVPFFHGQWGSE